MFSIGSKSFRKTPSIENKMCTIIFRVTNIWQVKIDALAWSYDLTLGIFNAIGYPENKMSWNEVQAAVPLITSSPQPQSRSHTA